MVGPRARRPAIATTARLGPRRPRPDPHGRRAPDGGPPGRAPRPPRRTTPRRAGRMRAGRAAPAPAGGPSAPPAVTAHTAAGRPARAGAGGGRPALAPRAGRPAPRRGRRRQARPAAIEGYALNLCLTFEPLLRNRLRKGEPVVRPGRKARGLPDGRSPSCQEAR